MPRMPRAHLTRLRSTAYMAILFPSLLTAKPPVSIPHYLIDIVCHLSIVKPDKEARISTRTPGASEAIPIPALPHSATPQLPSGNPKPPPAVSDAAVDTYITQQEWHRNTYVFPSKAPIQSNHHQKPNMNLQHRMPPKAHPQAT